MGKIKNIYQTKSNSLEIKDLDTKNKLAVFVIANSNNIDKKGEKIDTKAFNKTIADNPHKWHFINHNPDSFVGKFKEMYVEDGKLFAVSDLSVENSNAKNLLTAYEKGEITEHSIGYYIRDYKYIRDNSVDNEIYDFEMNEFIKGYLLLTEIEIFEGSSLTVEAANPDTNLSVSKILPKKRNLKRQLVL